MLSNTGRPLAKVVLGPLVRLLAKAKVSPDVVTIAGTVAVVAVALWLFPTGHLAWGGIALAVLSLTDSVDGLLARELGTSSAWGAFLDSTLDRIGDAAIFTGLIVWYVTGGDHLPNAFLALACLVLGSVVPYVRARAEGLGLTASGGIAERADRLAAVLIGAMLVGFGLPDWLLTIVLSLLTVASFVTIIQRMVAVRRQCTAASGSDSSAMGRGSPTADPPATEDENS